MTKRRTKKEKEEKEKEKTNPPHLTTIEGGKAG